ncbi:MAG: hypothetical protein C4567_09410 [Deltaproteobacteria bacterium]|nr:MAG: hypothetical protein C4567_09410 [Deltaproteobacteria bacterium]
MWFTKHVKLGLCLALLMVGGGSCLARPLPPVSGAALQPGRFLEGFYIAPDFAPGKASYDLEPFTVDQAREVAPDEFATLLNEELARAWEANGLKVKGPQGACRVSGAVKEVRLKGTHFRFFTGRIAVDLDVAGAFTQEGRTVFAFSDRVRLSSPINPGPPAPKERELLLKQAVRTFVNHLLTELLLYRPSGPEEEG